METKKIFQASNFNILMADGGKLKRIIIADVAQTWNLVYYETHPHFAFWLNFISKAKDNKDAAIALDATITMLYQLSNIGVHGPETTNALVEVVNKAVERISAALKKVSDEQQEQKDAEDWMKREQALEDMQEAAKAEGDGLE